MNPSRSALTEFVHDFDLRNTVGIISFTATIQIFFRHKLMISESNVQVITSSDLATVYLLGDDSEFDFLPDLLQASTHLFTYIKNEYLRILSSPDEEKFIVSIFPKTM